MELTFESVRSDWYATNTLLPRLVVNAVRRQQPLNLIRFPAQWIPVCAHYGISFVDPQPPRHYLPLFSDLAPSQIVYLAEAAKVNKASRPLLEAAVALDPVIADFVYIVDHKLSAAGHLNPVGNGVNLLNTWHSFARPEIICLQLEMARTAITADAVLLMPCSRQRPYHASRTHARLRQQLEMAGYLAGAFAPVVVTALGVIPQSYWQHPLVMTYDAGAVDLWRVFQLLQTFFSINRFATVVDCLSFKPYSDMLQILSRLGIARTPVRPLKIRWKGFHASPP